MDILGTGIDTIEVERIKRALERSATGERFRARVFTEGEIAYCESRGRARYQSYAARFAAKEAAMKALGTGWARGVRWRDIEVVREESGKPTLKLAGVALSIADGLGVKHIAMTITHSGNLAIAQVIFES